MSKIKPYVSAILTLTLVILAYFLSNHNRDLMLPGNKVLFVYLIFAGTLAVSALFFFKSRNEMKKYFYVILIILITAPFVSMISLNLPQYNFSKNASTSLDYFLKSGNRSMENIDIDYNSYIGDLQPVIFDLFQKKEVIVDSEIINDNALRIIEGLDWSTADISSVDENRIDDYVSSFKPQEITLTDKDNNSRSIMIFTGEQFENAHKLFVKLIDNYIYIFSEDTIDIEYQPVQKELLKQFEEDDYVTVNLQFHNDTSISRVRNGNSPIRMITLLVFLSFIGMLFFVPMINRNLVSVKISILLAFIIGAILQIYIIMILGLSRIPINLVNVIIMNTVLIIIWFLAWSRTGYKKAKIQLSPEIIIFLVYVLGCIIYFSVKPHVFLSFDSFTNVYIGKKIAYSGQIQKDLTSLLMFSLVSPNWHALSSMAGIYLNYAFQPVFGILGYSAFIYLVNDKLKRHEMRPGIRRLIIVTAIMNIVLLPEMVINASWILNNLSIGISYGISVVLLLLYNKNNQKSYIIISYFIFLFTGIARIEGGLFAVFYLMLLYKSDIRDKLKRFLISGFTVIYALLFVCYVMMSDHIEEGFWTPQNAALTLGLLICFSIFVFLNRIIRKKFYKIVDNIDYLMLAAILCAGIALALRDPGKALINIQNIVMNLISTGYYGLLFPCILITFSIYLLFNKNISKEVRLISVQCFSYVLLIFVLMLFSTHNSRVGYGDSSCRMILHILPVFGLLIVQLIAEIYEVSIAEKGVSYNGNQIL